MGGLFSFAFSHFIVYGFDPKLEDTDIKRFINKNFDFNYYSIKKLENPKYVLFSFTDEYTCEQAAYELYQFRTGNVKFIIVQVIDSMEEAINQMNAKLKSLEPNPINPEYISTDAELIVPNIEIDFPEQIRLKSLQTTQQIREQFLPTFCNVTTIEPDKNTCFWNRGMFDIGYDENGEISIGFSYGSKQSSYIIPLQTKQIYFAPIYSVVESLLSFIKSSELLPFNPQTETGVWKSVFIQVANNNSNFIATIETNEEITNSVEENLISALKNVPSINLKYHGNIKTIKGTGYIKEQIDNILFQITAPIFNFWPVNSATFYKYIGALLFLFSDENSEKSLVHIYSKLCLTSLCLAKYVKTVNAIDNDKNCLEYAEQIAAMNSINNIEFHYTKNVEKMSKQILSQFKKENLIVLIDMVKSLQLKKTLSSIFESNPQSIVLTCESTSLPSEISMFLSKYYIESCFIVDYYPHTNKNFYVTVLQANSQN